MLTFYSVVATHHEEAATPAESYPQLDVFQVVGAIATVVAAGLAVWALIEARRTVRETRSMRREERLADLLALIADVGEYLEQVPPRLESHSSGCTSPSYGSKPRSTRLAKACLPVERSLEQT